jgi:hypothetical protein
MDENQVNLRWYIDESDWGLEDSDDEGPYYEINIWLSINYLMPITQKPTIEYIHSKNASKKRFLSTFEAELFEKRIRLLKIPFGNDLDLANMWRVNPYDNYRVVLEGSGFKAEFTWSDNESGNDPKAYGSLTKLVDLISKIEPIDYDCMGIELPHPKM